MGGQGGRIAQLFIAQPLGSQGLSGVRAKSWHALLFEAYRLNEDDLDHDSSILNQVWIC
jgi:hypothetical protein